MRMLNSQEVAVVAGGLLVADYYGSGSFGDGGGGGGGDYYAGLGAVLDFGGRLYTAYEAVNWAITASGVGIAGAGANENDNGGTSYGIDVCNTFGCP